MFRNYLKIAIRNIQRHRGYTLINITGLAIGLACCLVIMLYVFNELQFERIHENRDRIYRVAGELNMGGQKDRVAALLPPMGPFLKDEFPEIINSVRLFNYDGYMENAVFTHKKQRSRNLTFILPTRRFLIFSHCHC